MTADNDSFIAWAANAKDAPLVETELKLRAWDEDCIEMDVTHCGICGTDEHTLSESWGPTDWPCVVGHEIVGKVTRVGKNVTHLKVGDRAGVGAQSGSCHQCRNCLQGNGNLCMKSIIMTYNSTWLNGDKTYGGYARKWRGESHFVFKVPDHLPSDIACTFFCAGVTTYAPLKRTHVNSTSVVGVMGIGGLGHYGILWAKAMGAKVVGMSHSDKKRDVAFELGCDEFLVTSDSEAMAKYQHELTHILCTGTGSDFEWATYLALLQPNGYFLNVSAPEWDFPKINAMTLIFNQVFIHGSHVGNPEEIRDMLDFADKHNVRPWIKKYPMKNVNKALEDFRAGKPRFRFVLEI